jgi:hypothetical protein
VHDLKIVKIFFAFSMLAFAISAATLCNIETASNTVVCLVGFAWCAAIYCLFDIADCE